MHTHAFLHTHKCTHTEINELFYIAKVILSSTTEVVLSALCGGDGAEPMQAIECGELEKPAQFT